MSTEAQQLARAFGRLDGALAVFGDGDELTPMLRRTEVVASSRIDGNQASLIDLLDAEAGLAVTGPASDVAELRSLSDLVTTLATSLPAALSPANWLLKIHGDLARRLGHTGVGWRSAPLWIGPSGSTRAEARHIPPPPDQVPGLMLEWEQSWLKSADIDPIVKLSASLAALESIHPFTELNARVSRLWLQKGLVQLGFIRRSSLLWSGQQLRRRHEARQAIQAQRSDSNDGSWTRLFGSMLQQAADETTNAVSRVAALRCAHRKMIVADFGRTVPQALRLADSLCAQPMVGIKDVIELTGVTFPAANDLVRRFEGAGLLVEVTGNARNRRFRYAPFVRIFLDDE
jgi:Fic family protein